jgi:gentisate 1,2-dioxygenase
VSIAVNRTRSLDQFMGKLEALGIRIARPGEDALFTAEPEPSMVPMHWKWSELKPLFSDLSEHLKLTPGGARRTLKLANPGLPYGTTPTFWASIQYILPGETATAHRHTPSAFRFVMEGEGCRTTVEGENYPMNEGDLVLTPSWAWHDHVHHGSGPMIWLDVLDISLVRSLNSTFFQDYHRDVQPINQVPDRSYRQHGSGLLRPPGEPSSAAVSPLLVYPRSVMESALSEAEALPADPNDDVILEYQNPATGAAAMLTMSLKAQTLRPGFRGSYHRHTGSKVYWVISGAGATTVGGRRFEWSSGDFLAIPSWAPHRHENPGHESARLFRVDDTPTLRAFGLYREESLPDDWTATRDQNR